MQKTIFLVLFFMLNALNATNLLKYDVFDGEQNIDLKLSFDTPYRGEITQTNEKNMVIVTLKDLNLAEKFNHQINSQIGSEFVISPMDNAVKIELNTNKNIVVKPSLNDDKSELMLKFSQSTQSAILPQSKAQDESVCLAQKMEKMMMKFGQLLKMRAWIIQHKKWIKKPI